jgi:hypothetical protein
MLIPELSDLLPNPRYEKHGQCNRCGWCCSHEDCEHFVPAEETEDGLAICLIYDEKRELKCEAFPCSPPITHDECGYWFYDKWTKKKLDCKEVY